MAESDPIKNDANKLFIVESNGMVFSDVVGIGYPHLRYVFNFTMGTQKKSNQATTVATS